MPKAELEAVRGGGLLSFCFEPRMRSIPSIPLGAGSMFLGRWDPVQIAGLTPSRGATANKQEGMFMNFNLEASEFQRAWLQRALGAFHEDGWFTDILYRAKGGKEANVYCCRASPETGYEFVAAKVYRHRRLRSMKNYAVYREGRHITSDRRELRALKKKTRIGKAVEDGAWIRHEYDTMTRLYDMGASVPEPLARGSTALLMGYIGDEHGAAPLLHEIALKEDQAQDFFDRLMYNVEIFLACDLVHGDLSAYNVLYWDDDFRIIDFPQAVDPVLNPNAFSMLARDVERLCQYFSRYGVEANYVDLAADLWERFSRRELAV